MKIYKHLLVSCVAFLAAAFAAAGQEVTLETNIFSIKGKDTLRIDTYIDYTIPVPEDGRPVVIYIHGGGFTMGHRINAAQEVFCRHMAGEGFLAASVDYRLAGYGFNEVDGVMTNPYNVESVYGTVKIACEDVVDATLYILGNEAFAANPSQVSLAGGSAGAFTALTLVYDQCNGAEYTCSLPEGFKYASTISQAGGVGTLEKELCWKSKPGPIMFFHGTEDIVVPMGQIDMGGTAIVGTRMLSDQLTEMGVPHWTWIQRGSDHVMAMKPCTEYLDEQASFLKNWATGKTTDTVYTELTEVEPANMVSVEAMVKYVPLYILGYGKYIDEIDWDNLDPGDSIVY